MKVAIHQPNFFARPKVLQKLAAADIWVVLDNAQYVAREWQNRTAIVPTHGERRAYWLTLPVLHTGTVETKICDKEIVDEPQLAHYVEQSIYHAFHTAPYWADVRDMVCDSQLDQALETLTAAGISTSIASLQLAGRLPALIFASSLKANGKASEWMAAICREIGADTYLADSGSHSYLQDDDFKDIQVLWQRWQEPNSIWPEIQSWRNISAINYLARAGKVAFASHLVKSEFVSER